MSVGSKGSDKVITADKPDVESIKWKNELGTKKSADMVVSHQSIFKSCKYIKTTLPSKRKIKGNLAGGKTLFSRTAK